MSQRKQHWDQIYQNRTPADVSWFQAEPTLSMSLIQACALDSNSAIIDVGGGASRLVDHLLDRGYTNLAVLDISSRAVEHAQSRLEKRAADVEWFVDDITRFTPPRKFNCWHDRAVFHFLTDPREREQYLRVMGQALVPDAHVIIATFAIGGPETCSGLDIVQYDADRMTDTLGDHYALQDVKHETHVTPADAKQAFNYFHFKKIK